MKNKIILNLSLMFLFLYMPICSFSYCVMLGKNYNILANSNKVGTLEIISNPGIHNINILFFNDKDKPKYEEKQHNFMNDEIDNYDDYHSSYLLTRIMTKNILPTEYELLTSIINGMKKRLLQIDILFNNVTDTGSAVSGQKSLVYRWFEYSFNFFFTNTGTNFLLISDKKNAVFISLNQLKIYDAEQYKESIAVNKVTMLNCSVTNYLQHKENDSMKSSIENLNTKHLKRGSRVVSFKDTEKLSVKKRLSSRFASFKGGKKIHAPERDFRDDQSMLNILNNYCETKIENAFFLLSKLFILHLSNLASVHFSTNSTDIVNHDPIILINPFFPIFHNNFKQKPQISLINLYLLNVSTKIFTSDDNHYLIFYFYHKKSNLKSLIDSFNDKVHTDDFLTITTSITGIITDIQIIEKNNAIHFTLSNE